MKALTTFYLVSSTNHGADQTFTGPLYEDVDAVGLIAGSIEMQHKVRFHKILTSIDVVIAEYDFDEALIALDSLLGSLTSDSKA